MTTMLIANNCTVDNGQFMGDQLCYVKAAYLFVQNQPDVTKILMSVSPSNELHFVWQKFIDTHNVQLVYDTFDPGNNDQRWEAWDIWRRDRAIEGIPFTHYRELYLRIHGALRQNILCGSERGLGRKNIYEYVYFGQEHLPETCIGSDWYNDTLVDHPERRPLLDVYISPQCKTQGNVTFTFDFWAAVVRKLITTGVSVTVGYNGSFCDELLGNPLYRKHWGSYKDWFIQVCQHKLVACGNTGTGWVAAACGVPLITMEPHNSCMADHRYRECGLQNIVEVVDGYVLDSMDNDMRLVADYVATRIKEEVHRRIVLTTGCYDVLHSGHIRHLERAKALGTKLIVALNSDASIRALKGESRPINTQEQRKVVLEALRSVDEVKIFDGPNALDLIGDIKPAILACGFGYTTDTIIGKDLVESWGGQVIVTCEGDASSEPSTTKTVAKLRAADIADACRVGVEISVNPFAKLKLLASKLIETLHLPGAIADLGAYKGGTTVILRRLAPTKPLYVFDTWYGNPYDDPLCHHKKGEWAVSLDDCKKIVGNGDLTFYRPGVFPASASGESFSFVYVDMDTEQATRDAIEYFWPRLTPGGQMFFDDYDWPPCAGVKKAVDEAFPEIERVVYPHQYSCVVVKR